MINFVDIPLQDNNYLPQHDQLDAMLAEGWKIIGHAVFSDSVGFEAYERYTLHKADKPKDISLIERLVSAETMEEKEAAYLEIGKFLVPEGRS